MEAITDTPVVTPRHLWGLFEPIHAVTYFSPEAVAAFEDAGLRGFWRGYFAGRAAPLGAVRPEPAAAVFCSFAPSMVAESLPSVWETVHPEQALEVRRAGARAALARLLAGQEDEVVRAGELLAAAAVAPDSTGRPLTAANVALPWPRDPLDRLWHAATILREHRGDGHVAAQLAEDLDGCEILALRVGIDLPRSELQPYRGWTDDEWDASVRRLVERGLLVPDGQATDEGRRVLAGIEEATDRAAARPWAPVDTGELGAVLSPLAETVAKTLRFPNPIGLPDRIRGA
ncbi:SCO6745 family protein [Streptomyces sp. NPDC001985]|uniref:SCO6745 family protein n=1 Tax=Streptomyces sp. NPDC001985 TaxID=3154406 RepID=UPI003316DAA3